MMYLMFWCDFFAGGPMYGNFGDSPTKPAPEFEERHPDYNEQSKGPSQAEQYNPEAEQDDAKSAKRSRWSNEGHGSKAGLDDASQKLALANVQALAAKFSKPVENEEPPPPEDELPAKPVVDITQANTEETVSNVLGQLYDDDDDDDDDEQSPAPSVPVETHQSTDSVSEPPQEHNEPAETTTLTSNGLPSENAIESNVISDKISTNSDIPADETNVASETDNPVESNADVVS